MLADKAAQHPDREFLHYLPDGRRLSFGDLHLLSNRIANGLIASGIKPGAHVAVMMENSPEQLLSYFALGKIGAVAVPINVAARGQLLRYYLQHADTTALIGDGGLLPHLAEIHDVVPEIATIIALGERADTLNAVIDFGDLQRAPDHAPDIAVRFSDLAFLLYTSGTTGPSKAIMFTHAYALLYGIDQADNYRYVSSDIVHVCLPYFHANGLLSNTYGPLVSGARVALARRFSASNYWNEVRSSGATALSLLGSIGNVLWSLPPSPSDTDHAVRQAVIVPVPANARAFEKRFGLRFISVYGLTDYCPGATVFTLDDPPAKLGSGGRPRRDMQVAIFDENDMPVPPGEIGEIVLRSKTSWGTASGYYKMPEATLTSRRNMWFHTGDRGYFDEDGYLFFADRKKDSIRRRGENISAFEVEQAVCSHPGVAEAAAFPMTSPLSEDEVAVAIIAMPGTTVSEAEVIEHCQLNVSYFMVPRYIRFVRDLPRSGTHKVEKYKLKQEAEADRSLYWDREEAGMVVRR